MNIFNCFTATKTQQLDYPSQNIRWLAKDTCQYVNHRQTGQEDVAVGWESKSCFHGMYHEDVEQNCERISDNVDDVSDNKTKLKWDICRTSHL